MDIMGQHSVSRMRGLFDEPARYRPVSLRDRKQSSARAPDTGTGS